MKVIRVICVWCLVAALWCFCIVKSCAQSVPLIKVKHNSFVSYYDQQLKNPALVCYMLEYKHFSGSCKVSGRHFKADTKLPRPRVMDKDYTGSGYVRGHLCSAGDRDSDRAWLKETYLTSNLVPMTMYCNSGPWKSIEDSCRYLAIVGHKLLVARGPLYYNSGMPNASVILARYAIQVPDGFFCFAKCLDCGLVVYLVCENSGTNLLQHVIRDGSGSLCVTKPFRNDERISVLLQNILGTWSREVYETITH